MKISTKVEFGIIAVIDIASHSLNGNAVTTPEIAKRQNISKKYLEQILSSLSSAGLVRGQKGSNGGYVIAKGLKEITFKDIINALDANVLSNVYFNTRGDDDVMIRLIDNSLWSKMSSYLQEYAESITLAQLCDEYIKNNEIWTYSEEKRWLFLFYRILFKAFNNLTGFFNVIFRVCK